MKRYIVNLSDGFTADYRRRQLWWYENREKNPTALDDEFSVFFDNVKDSPWSGTRLEGQPKELRSMLLRTTHHRIAYRINDDDSIFVVAIWDTRQATPRF